MTRIAVLSGIISLMLGFSASADQARYLVKFKSPNTFNHIVAQMKQAAPMSIHGATISTQGFHLFNAAATSAKALENVQMLVIKANSATARNLATNPNVAFIEKEVIHPMPKMHSTLPSSLSQDDAGPIPMPWGIKAVKAPQAWNVTKGQGVKVLVLDTGVDKDHPALQSRFVAGKNFVGDSNEADFHDTEGHGTHVSGTILADGHNGGLVGVAPEASLYMGRVCGNLGCSSVAIIEGLNWGIQQKVQVVNMSLGGAWITPAEEAAYKSAEDANVMVIAAAGNDGTNKVSYPAAEPTVLAVGAIDSTLQRASFSQYGPELDVVAPGVDVFSSVPRGMGRKSDVQIDMSSGKGLETTSSMAMQGAPVASSGSLAVVDCGLGKPENFANVDVNGKIALIQRGEITFADKVNNAIKAGAKGVLIYNNADGLIRGGLTTDGSEVAVPAVMIEQAVGQSMVDALNAHKTLKSVVSIIATDYDVYEGTSMATPHATGVAALVRAANPSLTPAQVRQVMEETAAPLGPNDNNEYGHGLLDAASAVQRATMDVSSGLVKVSGL